MNQLSRILQSFALGVIFGCAALLLISCGNDNSEFYAPEVPAAEAGAPSAASPEDADAEPLDGKALYAKHCSGCHGALVVSEKLGRNADQIESAIGQIIEMAVLENLRASEIEAIATALAITGAEPPVRGNGKPKKPK